MISIYCHKLGNGGAEIAIVEIANLLASEGVSVEVVTSSDREQLFRDLSPDVSRYVIGSGRTLSDLFPLTVYLRRRAPEQLISTLFRCNVIASAASVLSGWSGRLVLRETTPIYDRAKGLRRLLISILYKLMALRVDKVIAPSATLLAGLRNMSRRYASKAEVVPNLVRRASSCEGASFGDAKGRVLVVGRLESVKGIDLVLSAVARCGACSKLDVYGEGSQRGELEEEARTLGIDGMVKFHGHVHDISTIHAGGGVLVSASHFEGFPNAIVEALVSGMSVVIVGNVDCFSDIVSVLGLNERCFVPVRDSVQLAERIGEALINPEKFRADPVLVDRYLAGVRGLVTRGYLSALERKR